MAVPLTDEQFALLYNAFARMMNADVEMIASAELDHHEIGEQVKANFEIWELLKKIKAAEL